MREKRQGDAMDLGSPNPHFVWTGCFQNPLPQISLQRAARGASALGAILSLVVQALSPPQEAGAYPSSDFQPGAPRSCLIHINPSPCMCPQQSIRVHPHILGALANGGYGISSIGIGGDLGTCRGGHTLSAGSRRRRAAGNGRVAIPED